MFRIEVYWTGYGIDYGVCTVPIPDTYKVSGENLGQTLYKILSKDVYEHDNITVKICPQDI